MSQIWKLFALLLVLLLLTGCSAPEEKETEAPTQPPTETSAPVQTLPETSEAPVPETTEAPTEETVPYEATITPVITSAQTQVTVTTADEFLAAIAPDTEIIVDAPLIDELPMALECEVISYDPETCRLVGRIVNVCADERILTDGKVDLGKFHPITYDPCSHSYVALGAVVGKAFSDGRKLK